MSSIKCFVFVNRDMIFELDESLEIRNSLIDLAISTSVHNNNNHHNSNTAKRVSPPNKVGKLLLSLDNNYSPRRQVGYHPAVYYHHLSIYIPINYFLISSIIIYTIGYYFYIVHQQNITCYVIIFIIYSLSLSLYIYIGFK